MPAVFLTGATGFIGSAVLTALLAEGRSVTALVRTQEKADQIAAAGATPLIGSITDLDLVATAAADSAGVIHTASPGDATSAELDRAFTASVLTALEGSSIPYVHTGGIWSFGAGDHITERTPSNPPALTLWRASVEALVRRSSVRTTIIVPGVVYGPSGTGLAALLRPDADGTTRLIGSGDQHWTTVHSGDLAQLYVLALDAADQDALYIGAGGTNPTVRELASAIPGASTIVAESDDETRERLGTAFADALLLDQQASGSLARTELGWEPNHPQLITELGKS